jgi:hypothetical protein
VSKRYTEYRLPLFSDLRLLFGYPNRAWLENNQDFDSVLQRLCQTFLTSALLSKSSQFWNQAGFLLMTFCFVLELSFRQRMVFSARMRKGNVAGLSPAIDLLRLLTPCLHRVTDENRPRLISRTHLFGDRFCLRPGSYPLGASQEYVFLEGICEQQALCFPLSLSPIGSRRAPGKTAGQHRRD